MYYSNQSLIEYTEYHTRFILNKIYIHEFNYLFYKLKFKCFTRNI